MNDAAPCERLEWDSEWFGISIGRLLADQWTDAVAAAAKAWCERERVECLYSLFDAGDIGSLRAAERSRMLLVDVRVTLDCALESGGGPRVSSVVRPMRSEDISVLLPDTRVMFRGSRFYNDPYLDPTRCDALYAAWLENSFKGYADAVLVADEEGTPCGFITCHLKAHDVGQIGLTGVNVAAQGHGMGRALVAAALRWFADQGCRSAVVVTQGGNAGAQRLYQSCGFRTRHMGIWHHYWPRKVRP